MRDNLTTGFDWAVSPDATLIVGDAGDQSRVSALIAAHRMEPRHRIMARFAQRSDILCVPPVSARVHTGLDWDACE